MNVCLNKLLKDGDISQKAFDDIAEAWQKGDPEEVIKKADERIKATKNEKVKSAYDHVKLKELKSYLDEAPDPEEALYDLITMRNGMPGKKANVEIAKEGVFGKLAKPIMKELDKVRKFKGFDNALLKDVGVALFTKGAPVSAEVKGIATSLQKAFDDINNTLKAYGYKPFVDNINDLARTSPDILKYSPEEFVNKVSPLVTNPEDIPNVYEAVKAGEEVSGLKFKSAEDSLKYQKEFGGNSFENVLGYLEKASAKLAEVEILGTRATENIEKLVKGSSIPKDEQFDVIAKANKLLQFATGAESIKKNPTKTAAALSIMRPMGTAFMLGQAVVMTLVDHGTLALAARMNGMPVLQTYRSMLKMMSKKDRHGMAQLGFQLDSVMSVLTQTSRFNPHASINQTYNKIATGVLEYSGLMVVNDMHTLAFKNGMLVHFRNHMNSTFQGLAQKNIKLQRQLTKYDITPDDWDIMRKSMTKEDLHLDPSVLPDGVASKFYRMVNEEAKYGIISPGARSQWFTSIGGQQKGTVKGELARNMTQFKSSIVETVLRHVMRAMRQDTGSNKIKYAAEYTVITTLIGGMIYEIHQLLDGKTPLDPIKHPDEYIANSLRYGGALPIVTDMLLPYLIAPTQFEKMKSPAELASGMLLPPTLNHLLGIGADTIQSITEKAKGDDAKAMKELSQAVSGTLRLVPGSNIWYVKELYNEYIIDTTKKILDPNGYYKSKNREAREMNKMDQDFLF